MLLILKDSCQASLWTTIYPSNVTLIKFMRVACSPSRLLVIVLSCLLLLKHYFSVRCCKFFGVAHWYSCCRKGQGHRLNLTDGFILQIIGEILFGCLRKETWTCRYESGNLRAVLLVAHTVQGSQKGLMK